MRIACWQTGTTTSDEAGLLRGVAAAAGAARDGGAELLVLPELSLTGYHTDRSELARAADRAGELAGWADALAARTGIGLVYGLPEHARTGLVNTVRLVGADGVRLAAYHKTHLYGRSERSVFTAGDVPVVQARIGGLTVGLLICYDIEFPEVVRAHALRGTDLLVAPSALVRPWEFVAQVLVPARAFESQMYVAYTNWAGPAGGVHYCGLSRVVAPDGRVVTASDLGDQLLYADIDPAVIRAARVATAYLADRRPELYREPPRPALDEQRNPNDSGVAQ